jgi:chemotaxis protein methyltransferase CheR
MEITNKDSEFVLTQSQFSKIQQKIKKLAGVNLSDQKQNMVFSRLSRRMRQIHVYDFDQYLRKVESSLNEQQAFIDALTTNLTSFFREPHHFTALEQYLAHQTSTVKVWSAGCSSGEEAYSIAMTAALASSTFKPKIHIHATDINSQVLKVAKRGVYNFDALQKVTPKIQKQFFQRGKGLNKGLVRVIPEILPLVTFSQLNFLTPHYSVPKDLDIIFCRNALIYFDTPTTDLIINRMLSHLKPNGLFIVGHSENYIRFNEQISLLGNTVYVKG